MIREFIQTASNYGDIELDFPLTITGEESGYVRFTVHLKEARAYEWSARMVNTKVGKEKVTLVEVKSVNCALAERFFVSRPSDLISILYT